MLQISFIILFQLSLKIPSLCSLLFPSLCLRLIPSIFITSNVLKALNSGWYKF